ncbi:MAG: hypothetical protein K6E91_12440 [Butyrivibrio sp.]|nr:hypothetical protein [Butyrivibrio sp.]
MHIPTIALIIAIIGLLSSSLLVGGIISLVSLVMGIILLRKEKTIAAVRVIAISVAGLLVPFIMYFNTYGVSLPSKNDISKNPYKEILSTNYSNMGIALAGDSSDDQIREGAAGIDAANSRTTASDELQEAIAKAGKESAAGSLEGEASGSVLYTEAENAISDAENPAKDDPMDDEMVYIGLTDSVRRGVIEHIGENKDVTDDGTVTGADSVSADKKNASSDEQGEAGAGASTGNIFESLDSISESDKNKGGIVSIAARDDDMPSYGGLPLGTLLVAQYFREDDHNCNPVLVLQNKTGETVRYECRFIARDAEGNSLALSEKTVEVVKNGSLFVFEGRFHKKDLGGKKPAVYEFSITKRTPYEKDMSSQISLYTATKSSTATLTAVNNSDKKVKVDAYILFFDGTELVDCMWMIPQNTDEVCLQPGTTASIEGDAYYRFDRVETYYTAYEAIEGQ